MKLRVAIVIGLAAVLLIVPTSAQARISLAEVKREGRAAMRDACFDRCIEWTVKSCKRVGNRRAKCFGRVTWEDSYGTVNTCRVTYRFKQKQGDAQIYEINKRCDAATKAG